MRRISLFVVVSLSWISMARTYHVRHSNDSVELYVDHDGTQFTDSNGKTLYKVKPLPKVPIFSMDFDIRDRGGRLVARVRERVMSVNCKSTVTYFDAVRGGGSSPRLASGSLDNWRPSRSVGKSTSYRETFRDICMILSGRVTGFSMPSPRRCPL
jgi:hypothetical protein